jgi:hypothetical protein
MGTLTLKKNTEWETEILCPFSALLLHIWACPRFSSVSAVRFVTSQARTLVKYWPRVSPPPFGKCEKVKEITNVTLRTRSTLVAFSKTLLRLNSGQVAGLCGLHYLVYWVAKSTNCGNAITMARQIFSKCTQVRIFSRLTNLWNCRTVIHLAHCTARSHWHVSQRCQTWENLIRKSIYLQINKHIF